MMTCISVALIHKRKARHAQLYFFFSSRRRHTRFDCDWSSDVCSSDLFGMSTLAVDSDELVAPVQVNTTDTEQLFSPSAVAHREREHRAVAVRPQRAEQIGRASCRERV